MKPIRIVPIIRANAYYIPAEQLTDDEIASAERKFTHRFYQDTACNKCEYLQDRHSDTCNECAAFKGEVRLASITPNKRYLKLPIGARKEVAAWMKKWDLRPKVIDKFAPECKIKPFHFIRKPWDYQIAAARDMIAKERGVIESPPRTGKTVIGSYIASKLLVKTLVLAHQREWLENFLETFVGSATSEAFTDINSKRVGFCKTIKDFEEKDVAFATFQQFFNANGQKVLKHISKLFNLVIFDEVHQSPAKVSAKVLAAFRARYRVGLSGSTDRKDGRYPLVSQLLGAVQHRTSIKVLRPRVQVLSTGIEFSVGKSASQAAFTYLVTRMESHRERRELLVKKAVELAKDGHFVLLPVSRIRSVTQYVREINQEAEEDWARPFFGGMKKQDRKKTIEDARNFKFRVLVGNSALISTGLNIPRASCLIYCCFSNNLPKAKQRFSRVLTPHEGKPEPTIILVMDDGDIMTRTRRNEFWNCLYKEFNPIIDNMTFQKLKAHFSSGRDTTVSRGDF